MAARTLQASVTRTIRLLRTSPERPQYRCLQGPPHGRFRFQQPATRQLSISYPHKSSSHSSVPRITTLSFWRSMVPTFLRPSSSSPNHSSSSTTAAASKHHLPARSPHWNPATFFIIIFLLIGSQAIQMIALRSQHAAFIRKADVRIGLLKEVIERVQRGEDVDVEEILGTGVKREEEEWEAAIEQIEREDALWREKSRRKEQESVRNKEQREPDRATIDADEEVSMDGKLKIVRSGKVDPGFY